MTTPNRVEANRRNALKSTGPRTPEGKGKSRRNALRHGLFSRNVLLADEKPADLRAFRAAMLEDLAPRGAMQEMLADQVVAAAWRLRRAMRIERQILTATYAQVTELNHNRNDPERSLGWAVYQDLQASDTCNKLSRYEGRLRRAFHQALLELRQWQEAGVDGRREATREEEDRGEEEEARNCQAQTTGECEAGEDEPPTEEDEKREETREDSPTEVDGDRETIRENPPTEEEGEGDDGGDGPSTEGVAEGPVNAPDEKGDGTNPTIPGDSGDVSGDRETACASSAGADPAFGNRPDPCEKGDPENPNLA